MSVIVPCLNEERHIEALLDGLRNQDLPPSEVVIVDTGSRDATVDKVRRHAAEHVDPPIRLLFSSVPGIAPALNMAVRAARGEVIVRLDGHSVPAPDFVRCSVTALEETGAGVVGGRWQIAADGDTIAARAIARGVAHRMGAGDAAYRVAGGARERRAVDTVPFGCFRRALWERLDGFDERLRTNEDYEFNYRVRRLGETVVFDPAIRATYFARPTLGQLAAQYFRYGWWKGRMLKAHPGSLRWRQAVPAGFVLVLLTLGSAAPFLPAARVPLVMLLVVYTGALAAASVHAARGTVDGAAALMLPFVFAVVHVAWGFGLLVNLASFGSWPFRPVPARLVDGAARLSREGRQAP